ncbi:MAG: hypothetical protein ACKVTZ_00940, partial [Bacteroidia bacterium]
SIAQSIGIGTASPDASAKLDISSTDRGLLIPRVSLSDGNTFGLAGNSNTEGMMVYNTNASITNGNGVGFYFWNGTAWKQLQIYGITETDPQVSSTTSNYIPKWNGTTLTDGIIYDNGTNIGIGTVSPTNRLDIQNSASVTANIQSSGSDAYTKNVAPTGFEAGTKLATYSAGTAINRWSYGKSLTAESGSNAGSNFFINRYDDTGTFLSQALCINRNNGYVGIGMTTAYAQLDVAGSNTSTVSLLLRSGNAGTSTSSSQIMFGYNNNTTYLHTLKTRHNSGAASGNAIDFYLWNYGVDAASVTGTKHVMTLQGNGAVGIGVTNPTEALEVSGKTKTTTFQLTNGATNGYVLQSDASGNGTWVAATSIASTNYWTLSGGNIYNNSGTNVGIGTTSPANKLHVNGNVNIGTSNTVTGTNASAVGTSNTTSGSNASAFGSSNTSSGNGTVVMGTSNTAAGNFSVAFNQSNTTTSSGTTSMVGGFQSYVSANLGLAIGYRDTTTAQGGATLGYNNNAEAEYAFATGNTNKVTGASGAAFGYNNKVSNLYATAFGSNNTASGESSIVSGNNNTTSGLYSVSFGHNNVASGSDALAWGFSNTSSGSRSTTFNQSNTASGTNSFAAGYSCLASANLATAFGNTNTASGEESAVFGNSNTAPSYSEFVVGMYATTYTPTATNYHSGTDRMFNVGVGYGNTNRADGFTILKNGNVGVGNSSPSEKLEVNGKTKTTNFQMTIGATNGYILQSDASGNGTWVNATSLAITETDPQVSATTTNLIPKWNGTTLTDGNIHDDGTVTVGYGTPSTINNTLQINGSIAVKTTAITTSNNSTTLDGDDYLIIYNGTTTGNSITLPTATTYTGRIYIIVNHSTDVVGISTYYLDNATTSTTVAIGTTIQLVSDGTNWHTIN